MSNAAAKVGHLEKQVRDLTSELTKWRALGGDLMHGAMLAVVGKTAATLQEDIRILQGRIVALEKERDDALANKDTR